MVEYRVIEEYDIFYIGVGTLPRDKLESYLVINKDYGVIEYHNPSIYFVRSWVKQMEEELQKPMEGPSFAPPAPPTGQMN
jgi:hypothetical protein